MDHMHRSRAILLRRQLSGLLELGEHPDLRERSPELVGDPGHEVVPKPVKFLLLTVHDDSSHPHAEGEKHEHREEGEP